MLFYEMYPNRKILVVFQPHLFSRTMDFVNEFAESLSKFDNVMLLDIYPARELPIEGVTSEWLLSKVNATQKKVISKEEVLTVIQEIQPEVVLMLGAGDIGVLVNEIRDHLK